MITAFVFLFGLAIGSFLNVVVYRIISGDSFVRGRSKCPTCSKQIRWMDNIPVLSFIWLKGKCRYCKKRISWAYPVLELTSGFLFVWWYGMGRFFFSLSESPYSVIQPGFWLLIGLGMLLLVAFDLFWGILPDFLTLGLSVLTFLYRFMLTVSGIMNLDDFLSYAAAAVGAWLFLLLIVKVTSGKGMGMGDVKLAILMGLLLGWPKILIGMFLAFLTGAGVGIILIIGGKKKFGQTIPFGPFLILGLLLALIWGDALWNLYMGALGF